MAHRLMHTLGFVAATLLAFGTDSARADAVGPYYATPSWDQTLPASTRFVVLSNFNSQAVLDRETGLVWQRTPSITSFSLFSAAESCKDSLVGGRVGWRLPAWNELASLFDPSQTALPFLPPGHPFFFPSISPPGVGFWTVSTAADGTGRFDIIFLATDFFGQPALRLDLPDNPSDLLSFWCVRGGGSPSVQ